MAGVSQHVQSPAPQSRARGLRRAFASQQERLIVERLPLTVGLYLGLVGLACVIEYFLRPHAHGAIVLTYLAHLTASVGLLGVARRGASARGLRPASAAFACGWSAILTTYSVLVVSNPERLASAQISLLYGLFFMVPWGWREQLAVSLAALFGLLASGVVGGASEAWLYGLVVVLTGGVTSVGGVIFLNRYRLADFVRNEKLSRASQARRRQAEVAAALLRVSEMLGRRVNEQDLLARLAQVAVEVVGCDWGSTFVWNNARGVYRLGGVFGEAAGVREEMEAIEFAPEDLPLIAALEGTSLVEIQDARTQALVPPALLERWQVASEVVAPIRRDERIVGALCLAYCERRGPFTPRERRLATGIAQSAALALATAEIIGDLRAANALRSQFVSTMSHELRTPLNVILGFVEMLQDPAIAPAESGNLLHRIEAAGRDLLRLVEDTLAMGRLEACREVVELKAIELGQLWGGLERECRDLSCAPGVVLQWHALDVEATAVTDTRKLSTVVRNLVHNACKFTERGWVRAALRVQPEEFELTIADSGIGIHVRDHESIFEMFRQADGSDRRRYGGSGLGLHIVRRYVDMLGGRIALESAPGSGSCFTVRFPRWAPAEVSPPARPARPAAAPPRPRRAATA